MMSIDMDQIETSKHQKHKKHKDKSSNPTGKKSEKHREKKRKHEESDVNDRVLSEKTPKQRFLHETSPNEAKIAPSDNADRSPFHLETSSLYVSLAPIAQGHPLQGLCAEHLSPTILTYFAPFHGTIISYTNPRMTTSPPGQLSPEEEHTVYAQALDEYAATHVWLTADFVMFRPSKGDLVEGYINLQNEGQIGLLCWNFFSASIDRKRLPREWKWVPGSMYTKKRRRKLKRPSPDLEEESEELSQSQNAAPKDADSIEGYFLDGHGAKVGGFVHFRVKDVDTSASVSRDVGFTSIRGTMLSDEDEAELVHDERSESLRQAGNEVDEAKALERSHALAMEKNNQNQDHTDDMDIDTT